TGRPGATHLSLPMDVLAGETDERVYGDERTSRYPAFRPAPDEDAIQAAARHIRDADRPVILVGGGVHSSRAWTAVRDLAEQVGMPVAETLTSAGAIGDSPFSIGVVGENGGRAYADEIVGESDCLLLLGTAVESVWTYKWSNPEDGETTILHADIDPGSIGRNYETDVALPGDLRRTVTALCEALPSDERWDPTDLAARHEEWIGPYRDRFEADEFPVEPERMVAGAANVLDEEAVIVADPGTACPYFAALYPFTQPGRHWVTPRAHGALGYTIPGVIGAQVAQPDTTVIGFTGDGSFGTSVGDLETAVRYDLPVTIVVVNNEAFSWIEAGQRSFADFSFGVDFEGMDFAAVAEGFGLTGFRVESAEDYEPTLRTAVEHDGPALVDLPVRPLPTIDDTPVDWLEPDE
ncbi:MAG: thiamine pyrophosphate-binding protein, partial [Halobacteriales archaeon]|nr:thiamine pyrophosphate-binding protein [Halobacteriales archaeon]